MGPVNNAQDPLTNHFPVKTRFSTHEKKKKKKKWETQTQMRLVSSVPKCHLRVEIIQIIGSGI